MPKPKLDHETRKMKRRAMPSRSAAKRIEYMQRYLASPETKLKIAARTSLNNAIQSGKVSRQPCEQCGAPKTQAHHSDYSKPLDVNWLCNACHGVKHKSHFCIRGHVRAPDNVGPTNGCRECARIRANISWQRKKLAKNSQGAMP